jgi:hypothetical protein
VEKGLAELKITLREIACNPEQAPVSDKRFAAHMAKLPPEALDRLDLWFPEDSLNVEYSTTDRQVFRPIQEGSPGQKTAALLAFLLSYGDEPLILDQPEDDLDNRLIYDLIVRQLREVKRRRQVLVITHNANIVVCISVIPDGIARQHRLIQGNPQGGNTAQSLCARESRRLFLPTREF